MRINVHQLLILLLFVVCFRIRTRSMEDSSTRLPEKVPFYYSSLFYSSPPFLAGPTNPFVIYSQEYGLILQLTHCFQSHLTTILFSAKAHVHFVFYQSSLLFGLQPQLTSISPSFTVNVHIAFSHSSHSYCLYL